MKIYALTDMAEMLQISKSTLYRWVKDESIPYTRMGRSILFREEKIQEWLETYSVPTKQENLRLHER
jgi:excisionase family DNA binding protein